MTIKNNLRLGLLIILFLSIILMGFTKAKEYKQVKIENSVVDYVIKIKDKTPPIRPTKREGRS